MVHSEPGFNRHGHYKLRSVRFIGVTPKSLLAKPLHLMGHLETESTDHFEGILPVTLRVRPEPR